MTVHRRTKPRFLTFHPDDVEHDLLAELDEWLGSLPIAQRRALRPTVEAEIRRRVHRHSPTWSDDGRRWLPIRPTKEPLHPARVVGAIAGVGHYRFPTAVALAWALSGVGPDVANLWSPDHARWQPSCRDEEDPTRFDALDRARTWQAHLAPESFDRRRPWLLDPDVLVRAAARRGHLVRDPGSLQPFVEAGFGRAAGARWHHLLSHRGLVGPGEATVDTALSWRRVGVGLPALHRWTAAAPARVRTRDHPISWQAAFLHAGCPDLLTALPWLDLVRKRDVTLEDAVLLHPSAPIDWVRAWA